MKERNVFSDPQPGDVIQQHPSRLFVRVTARDGDRVFWESRTETKGGKWRDPNAWTVGGWQKTICGNATVVRRGDDPAETASEAMQAEREET